MESVTASTVMERYLLHIKNLFPSPTNTFVKDMEKLHEIIKLKESKNIGKSVKKLNTKLRHRKKEEETVEKEFQEMKDYFSKELAFKDSIILENCSLIIQQQRKFCELMSKKRSTHDHQIFLQEKQLKFSREKLEEIITSKSQNFEKSRLDHMKAEKDKRAQWLTTKEILSDTLLRYDTEMMEQQNELEFIQNIKDSEEAELENYKKTCASQEITYHQLMKEKADYLEEERQKKLYEIRLKIAKRTIVKFIEQHYPAWKKRKLRASKKKGKYKYNPKTGQVKKSFRAYFE